MTTWSNNELDKISTAEELQIAGRKPDDTLRKFTTIWVVRVDDNLYVRSVYGRSSDWFKGIQLRHEGRIRAGGIEKDVRFVEIDTQDDINKRIDEVYTRKYRRYAQSIIDSTTSATAHSATIQLVPMQETK